VNQWLDWARQYPLDSSVVYARSTEEVQRIVSSGDSRIRVTGAGHSFTPLLSNSQLLLNVDQCSGVVDISPDDQRVTVGAGTRLYDLNAQLHDHGLALRNLGDIDVQSVAGATATATHGTGQQLKCLAAEITAIELVNAQAEVTSINGDVAELLHAGQVALGCLGVITAVELNVVPSYRLHRRTWSEPVEQTLQAAQSRWDRHRNFEFFYIPFTGYALAITHDVTDAPVRAGAQGDDDKAVRDLRRARTALKWVPRARTRVLRREIARFPAEDSVDYSWRLLASARNERFKEMEYHLPVDTALDAFNAVRDVIERDHPEVFFPIEVRKTAADDAWLSPFHGGPRISVAVHADYRDDHHALFAAVEPIFRRAGGRPHWGKMHALDATELASRYPRFDDFVDVRRQWDPEGRFLNPYTESLFGGDR
jgi:FAD-linked oxidoreductase